MIELDFIKWVLMATLGGFVYFIKRELSTKDDDLKRIRDDIQLLKDTRLHTNEFKEFKKELHSMFDTLRQDIRDLRKGSTHE